MSPIIIHTLKQAKRQRGFTLVEALIATTIFGLLAVGVMTMQTGHISLIENSRHRTIAVQLAEEGIERTMRTDFNTLRTIANGGAPLPEDDYGSIPGFEDYRRAIHVNNINGAIDMLQIQCEVYWRVSDNADSPTVLRVLLTEPPLAPKM